MTAAVISEPLSCSPRRRADSTSLRATSALPAWSGAGVSFDAGTSADTSALTLRPPSLARSHAHPLREDALWTEREEHGGDTEEHDVQGVASEVERDEDLHR